ncbi:MAG: hypothetical protein ACOZQL_41840 [Myxococcota bacterium]
MSARALHLAVAVSLGVWAGPARAHDVSVDLSGTLTTTSANNPRAGSFSLGASGSWDVNERWSLLGTLLYTRDLATRTRESFSPGSNIFLFNLGVLWLPTDSLMTTLSVVGSPPVQQSNATTTVGPAGRQVDLVVGSRTWSLGALWNGLWTINPLSDVEHTVDVSLGFTHFSVGQKLAVPNTLAGRVLESACATGDPYPVCPLVRGLSTPLEQGRLGAGYTATLFGRTELGVDLAYYLYDAAAPSSVGYFSLVTLGREVGNGVPVLPLRFTARPRVSRKLGPVTLKLSYQLGVYTEDLGTLHAVTLRASWKLTDLWRLSLTVTGQTDLAGGVASNPGGQALLGVMAAW